MMAEEGGREGFVFGYGIGLEEERVDRGED